MTLNEFKNNLSLVLSHAEERDAHEYVVFVSVGPHSEANQLQYMTSVSNYAAEFSEEVTEVLLKKEIVEFVHRFGYQPTTVVMCYVKRVPRAEVASSLIAFLQKAVDSPVPNATGNVVCHVFGLQPDEDK